MGFNVAIFTLNTVIDFGQKHKRKTIKEVIENDPDWVKWVVDKIVWFELDNEANDYLVKHLDDKWPDNDWGDGHPFDFGDN